MAETKFSASRWWCLPSAFSFAFSALLLLAAPDTGQRIFYVVMTTLSGYWFFRCWRAGVELDDKAVVLRGQIRTRRVAWADIDSPILLTMRTASPLQARFPYASLGLRLKTGRVVRFDDLAAPASHPVRVEMAMAAIAQRLNGLR